MLTSQTLAIEAARQLDPRRLPYITQAPWPYRDAPWTYHPVRRHLVIRSGSVEEAVRGLACALLAKDAYLGPRAVTEVPEHLSERHRICCKQLEDVMWALQR